MSKSASLVIIGASGFGLEVCFLAERLGKQINGFLDDGNNVQGTNVLGYPVLGLITSWPDYADCEFVVAIGNPRVRRKVVKKMYEFGIPQFASLIDPLALVSEKHVSIGKGSIICAGAMLTTQITLGEHAIINLNATVGHETKIGDFVTVAPLASLSGRVTLEDLVEVGTAACIRQGVGMGLGSMLGMGAVLTKNAEANAILVGNPAKVLRYASN